jgi:cation diffusion facilitator family transporter
VNVKKVLIIEGSINLLLMAVKLAVGFATFSTAILADAFHSLTDMANNVIAWFAVKQSEQPPDEDHQYGHKKFIPLAIFFLATLLCVVAIEVIVHAVGRIGEPVKNSSIGLVIMLVVLATNVCLSMWQSYWAKKLDSSLLQADASHTFSDVLTSIAVIVGWQLAARGYYWLDTVFAIIVALIIMFLAYKLFVESIPILVDRSLLNQTTIADRVTTIPDVKSVKMVRTRNDGQANFADITIKVDVNLSLEASHQLADKIELLLKQDFDIEDTVVHIEPTRE